MIVYQTFFPEAVQQNLPTGVGLLLHISAVYHKNPKNLECNILITVYKYDFLIIAQEIYMAWQIV